METNKASNVKGLPYGKRLRCGNFYVEKVSRALSKAEMKALRSELPMYKGRQRTAMPVIRVSDLQGMWRIEYAVASAMFHIFDSFEWDYFDGAYFIKDETCKRLVTMLFCDTTVLGDAEYVNARVKALNEFTMRVKAPEVSDEDDEKIVESLKALDIIEHGDESGEESK